MYQIIPIFLLSSFAFASDFSEALNSSVTHNPSVKSKLSELSGKGFSLRSAEAKFFPTLSLEASAVKDGQDQGFFRADQPVWTFGKLTNDVDEARGEIESKKLELLQTQRSVMEQTAYAYIDIQSLRRQLEVSEKNISEHTSLNDHILSRLDSQLATEADLSLGQSRLIQAQSQSKKIKGQLQNAITNLQSLTIKPVEVGSDQPHFINDAEDNSIILQLSMDKSADILLKRALLASANVRVSKAGSASMPDIKLRFEQDVFDNTVTGDKDSRVSLVFESSLDGLGFVASNNLSASREGYAAASEDLNDTINRVRRDVTSLLSDKETHADLVDAQTKTVLAVTKTQSSYLRLFKSGHKSWLDVLNIQRELTEERLELERLIGDYQKVLIKLARMSGQLDELAGI